MPEGVDPLALVQALLHVEAVARDWYDDDCTGRHNDALAAAVEALQALRTPPRPLPDGPGQWWGRLLCVTHLPIPALRAALAALEDDHG